MRRVWRAWQRAADVIDRAHCGPYEVEPRSLHPLLVLAVVVLALIAIILHIGA